MNDLISIEHFLQPSYSKEILQLNEVSRMHGLSLTEREATELCEVRNKAVSENDRIELGLGVLPLIVKMFCSSRYATKENYGYILEEVTSLFYYIKTETNESINDEDLVKELFRIFELKCRGSIDLLGTEAERLIRRLIAGKNYKKWYLYRDDLYLESVDASRDTPNDYIPDNYDSDYFELYELADHDYYDPEGIEGVWEEAEEGFDIDTFDDFR